MFLTPAIQANVTLPVARNEGRTVRLLFSVHRWVLLTVCNMIDQ